MGNDSEGLKNQVKGKAKQAEGRIRDAAADITGNKSEDFKGKAKRIEGEVQDKFGKAQREAD